MLGVDDGGRGVESGVRVGVRLVAKGEAYDVVAIIHERRLGRGDELRVLDGRHARRGVGGKPVCEQCHHRRQPDEPPRAMPAITIRHRQHRRQRQEQRRPLHLP